MVVESLLGAGEALPVSHNGGCTAAGHVYVAGRLYAYYICVRAHTSTDGRAVAIVHRMCISALYCVTGAVTMLSRSYMSLAARLSHL